LKEPILYQRNKYVDYSFSTNCSFQEKEAQCFILEYIFEFHSYSGQWNSALKHQQYQSNIIVFHFNLTNLWDSWLLWPNKSISLLRKIKIFYWFLWLFIQLSLTFEHFSYAGYPKMVKPLNRNKLAMFAWFNEL